MQKYKPQKVLNKRKKIEKFIIDETLIKTGSKYVWLWVAIEPMNKQILHCDMSFERTMLIVAERFIVSSLINNFGSNCFNIRRRCGVWYPPQACQFLKVNRHIHSSLEKSVIERTIQYVMIELQKALMIIFRVKRTSVS